MPEETKKIKAPFCTQCGRKMKVKEIEIQPIDIKVHTDTAYWIDPSTESIIQYKEKKRMNLLYNEIYNSDTGKKVVKTFALCPKYDDRKVKHDCQEMITPLRGTPFFSKI